MKKHTVIKVLIFGLVAQGVVQIAFAAKQPIASMQHTFPEGERLIYTRLVESFRKGQAQDVALQKQKLERNYPRSIHLDNAYYMLGALEFQAGRYGEALKSFEIVRSRYAKSNKRPAALFGTAMTYEKLNLKPQARRVLQTLTQEYPGSPEALRGAMYLKMENGQRSPSVKR